MKAFLIGMMVFVACLTAKAQDADFVIEGEEGKAIALSVEGFADHERSRLSVSKTSGDADDYEISDFVDGRISFLFHSANEYMFDFWEDLDGCRLNTKVRFIIQKDITLYVPNIFTPDGDGINDQFHIKYDISPKSFSIVIYNREGKKMFSSGNPDFRWDGSRCTPGVYSYVINYESLGRQKNMSGYITLVDRR